MWSEWRVELFVALLVAVGVFLLVEQMNIRQTLIGWLRAAVEAASSLTGRLGQRVAEMVRDRSFSDLVGIVLLAAAVIFALGRLRWRLLTLTRFSERACPRCESDLHRIHRRPGDRLLNLFVPVRRYQCKNRDCRWRGIRTGRSHLD
jgi:hypothetical protein